MVSLRLLSALCVLTIGLALSTADGFAQTRAQLIEGAKKEGHLILSWAPALWAASRGRRRWRKLSTRPTD